MTRSENRVDHLGATLRNAFPTKLDGTFYSMLAVLRDAEAALTEDALRSVYIKPAKLSGRGEVAGSNPVATVQRNQHQLATPRTASISHGR